MRFDPGRHDVLGEVARDVPVGLAVYLWHCLDGTAGLPALDVVQ